MAATRQRRQPVHIVAAGGLTTGRDLMWQGIRHLRQFTYRQLEDWVNRQPHNVRINDESIKTYVRALAKSGHLEECGSEGEGQYAAKRWKLVNDVGVDAPRVNRKGKSVTQGAARENMWRSIRILGSFDYRDLALAASTESCQVKAGDAKDYLRHLASAGYLATVQKGKAGLPARYRLLPSMNTGPRPPQVQRIKQVFDPNLGRVMHKGGEQ